MYQKEFIEKLEKSSLEDLIAIIHNDGDTYHTPFRVMENTIDNLKSLGLSYDDFISIIKNSSEYKGADKYFFFDKESEGLVSFTNKQDLIRLFGEDYFIVNML